MYDTEYGCQDRKDDVQAGVKSTALLFGDHVRSVLVGFAAVFVSCLVAAGALNGQTWVYYLVSVGGAVAHFAWQFATWDVDSPADCGAKFKVGHVLLPTDSVAAHMTTCRPTTTWATSSTPVSSWTTLRSAGFRYPSI